MEFGKLSPLALAQALKGVAPYGFRHIESANEVALPKGKGYFGNLPNQARSVSTEISASDESGSFPLLTPNLSKDQINHLLANKEPTQDIYEMAKKHAELRKATGMSPFATAFELRYPQE